MKARRKMKVYSPTQTTSYLDCPLKRQFQQQGYRKRGMTLADVKREIGGLFHELITVSSRRSEPPSRELFHLLCHKYDIAPFMWEDYREPILKGAVELYNNPPYSPWVIRDIGFRLGEEYGNCELDAILMQGNQVSFTDFKVKWEFKRSDYETQFWQDIEYDWQMLHYVWAVEKYFKTTLDVFGVTLVVLTPKVRVVHRFLPVKRHLVEWFERSAPEHWSVMQQQQFLWEHQPGYLAPMSNNHRGRYGPCEFYDACMVYQGESELMQVAFDKVERSK